MDGNMRVGIPDFIEKWVLSCRVCLLSFCRASHRLTFDVNTIMQKFQYFNKIINIIKRNKTQIKSMLSKKYFLTWVIDQDQSNS